MALRVGILYGMERTFPGPLAEAINRVGAGKVTGEAAQVGTLKFDERLPYDLILDRISHDVPFYRTLLKQQAMMGVQIVNNPFWWSADDKFIGNLIADRAGVAVPKTVLVPHKNPPPNTKHESFSNLSFPLDWDAVFAYLGFPIFLKPAYGGGFKDVYKVNNAAEFFRAYDSSRDVCMMAQEGIEYTEYFRCYGIGRSRVHVMRYDISQPFHLRYVQDGDPIEPTLLTKLRESVLNICNALGYDFNTVELAVRDGVPYAIDFTNPCPDADDFSVGEDNFKWVLDNAAEFLVERALRPLPFEPTGSWPRQMPSRPSGDASI